MFSNNDWNVTAPRLRSACLVLGLTLATAASADGAPTLTALASFDGHNNGEYPLGGLIADAAGNLYGTTSRGGTFGPSDNSYGTVFQLKADTNSITTLASFDGLNGAFPEAGLIADTAGNLYGTASVGGEFGVGTVFRFAVATNSISALASFNVDSGVRPSAELIADAAGNLYGTSTIGGSSDDHRGTVFRLDVGTNVLTNLAAFDGANGATPRAGLTADTAGNLYGTTVGGGTFGRGAVFRVDAVTGVLTTLASFDGANGAGPQATLIADANGNLLGTTIGFHPAIDDHRGTVFQLDVASNVITKLATFDGTNGAGPRGGLIADAAGNLYGTTYGGGAFNRGTVFRLDATTGNLTTLASFNGANGANPRATMIADANGNLYGTTERGGANNYGAIFRISDVGFVIAEPGTAGLLAAVVTCLACRAAFHGRCA